MVGYQDYGFASSAPPHTMRYLMPAILSLAGVVGPKTRVLDIGCGNGFLAGQFLGLGCQVTGIDLSEQGIMQARAAHPGGRFELLPADRHILEALSEDPFDLVVSTEVVEHLYDPRSYIAGCYTSLRPGGRFICTTPYHGYLKYLAIALAGKWDKHANPLWDGGHIKFWSRHTLSALMAETNFINIQFRGAGRLPYLWMSMVMSAEKSPVL